MERPRFIAINLFADTVAAMSLLVLLAVFVLWAASQGKAREFTFEGPDAVLHFCSRDGRLMMGVFTVDGANNRAWYWRRRGASMSDLLIRDDRYYTADLWGWGVAVPHGLVAGVVAIVPAWWWLVARDRGESVRRSTLGLCRVCGYDLRATQLRCPECGAAMTAKLGDQADPAAAR